MNALKPGSIKKVHPKEANKFKHVREKSSHSLEIHCPDLKIIPLQIENTFWLPEKLAPISQVKVTFSHTSFSGFTFRYHFQFWALVVSLSDIHRVFHGGVFMSSTFHIWHFNWISQNRCYRRYYLKFHLFIYLFDFCISWNFIHSFINSFIYLFWLILQQENVHNFLVACETYGCHRGDIFQTVDLTEDRNMPAVIKGIHSLGRTVS